MLSFQNVNFELKYIKTDTSVLCHVRIRRNLVRVTVGVKVTFGVRVTVGDPVLVV